MMAFDQLKAEEALMLVFTSTVMLIFCEATLFQGNLPSFIDISNFLDTFLKPYKTRPLKVTQKEPLFRAASETSVSKAIRTKINKLKPFLQDDDMILENDNTAVEDSDETTIIELTPNIKEKKENIRKGKGSDTTSTKKVDLYKDLREQVKKFLNREPISRKTKEGIVKTVDALITQIIGNQCSWKSSNDLEKIAVKMRNHGIGPILKAHNLTKQGWEHFKKQYIQLNQDKHIAETLLLFNKFQNLFSKIINDTTYLSKRYKIQCHLVDMDNDEIESLRHGHDMFRENKNNNECPQFKLCSREFKTFMAGFYKEVNDSAVSVFRNYAAMYSKDVNSDTSREKNSVVTLINNISNIVEAKTKNVFIKDLAKIKLDKDKDKSKNIKNLKQYIKNTVKHIKLSLKKNLAKYLKSLRVPLLLTIKEDIIVNLGVELGNLERDFTTQICSVFVTCNGGYSARRNNDLHSKPILNLGYGKKVYVKIQLTFDDNLKNDIARHGGLSNHGENKITTKTLFATKQKIKLTRTTPIVNITKPNLM